MSQTRKKITILSFEKSYGNGNKVGGSFKYRDKTIKDFIKIIHDANKEGAICTSRNWKKYNL